MGRALTTVLAAGLALFGGATSAVSHPHVFIEGGADLVFDDQGRLSALEITWIYDPLASLFIIEEVGLAFNQPLSPPERAELAAYQTEWAPDFEGDSYVYSAGAPVKMSGPQNPDADIHHGRLIITFTRTLETPVSPGEDTVVEIYDPTYYTAYTITEPPGITGNGTNCRARIDPFEPTSDLLALQVSLFDIPADEDPVGNVGALFADRIRVACD
ncbi:MAG: DUF1007 family protein [Pseudomonadota bacterium]